MGGRPSYAWKLGNVSADFWRVNFENRPENYFEIKTPEKSAKSREWLTLLIAYSRGLLLLPLGALVHH